jgi:hypothetical protein
VLPSFRVGYNISPFKGGSAVRNWLAAAVVVLSLGMSANSVPAQQGVGVPVLPSPSTTGTAPQAPIGDRQSTARDVPPDLAGPTNGATPSARVPTPNRHAGGPPTLEVGPSCEAAAQGSVILGRDKKACLGDETTAQDTLKQNWSKYAASDKNDCVGMVTTGGPPSYVELLSCVEILRDARNIRNGDALESDDQPVSTRRVRQGRR